MENKGNGIYFFLLGLLFLALTEKAVGQGASPPIIATIGGEVLYENEFRFYIEECRAGCIAYFTAKNGNCNNGDFWRHRFGCEMPCEWLKAAAIKKCRDDRFTLRFIRSYGILTDFQFSQLDSLTYTESRKRQALVAEGKPVYGVLEFDRHMFYAYLLSNGMIEANRRFKSKHPPSLATLRTYYERIKNKAFRFLPTRVIKVQQTSASRSEKFTLRFGPASAKAGELEWGEVYTKSMLLNQPGQQLSFKGTNRDQYILKCVSFKDNGYMPFADALENVRQYYTDQRIKKILDGYLQTAKIMINKPVYDAISIE